MRVVIPSVNYADFLADTLPAWQAFLPRDAKIAVVTTPEDRETQAVAASCDVPCCVTDVWTRDGAIFNKGSALDLAFGFAPGWTHPPSGKEVCLSIDADVYPFGQFPDRATLQPGVLYGCPRFQCDTREDLIAHLEGRKPRDAFQVILTRVRGEPNARLGTAQDLVTGAMTCLGYFQLFRYRFGICFGPSKTAGKYDLDFRRHFQRRHPLTSVWVFHLGEQNRENWRGRVVRPWGRA